MIKKELINLVCSGIGLIFAIVFLLISGLLLWILPGHYNILDAGYATTDNLYSVLSFLLILLIPALTMKAIAEEKQSSTFDLLLSRPISDLKIILNKILSLIIFIFILLFSTIIYLISLYQLGNPVGNIDLCTALVTYLSLIILSAIFITIGVFTSSLSKNQILAFILALIFNIFLFYGWNLIASIIDNNSIKLYLDKLSLSFHFNRLRKGLFYIDDLFIVVGYLFLFISITQTSLRKQKALYKNILFYISIFCILITVFFTFGRTDITTDKRYTLNKASTELMAKIGSEINENININIFLTGDLNYRLKQLENATAEVIYDLNEKCSNKIETHYRNVSTISSNPKEIAEYMTKQTMPPIQLNEIDRNGKISQQFIYPYAQIIYNEDTIVISLLKNKLGNSAEENLNLSIESLEFEFVDAINLVTKRETIDIAFIEGHGELSRAEVYDAEESLAKYYNINRGQLNNDVNVLDSFRAIIIAGPTKSYTEREKYILDQYLMKGGRILWLIDGAKINYEDLIETGTSASMKNEVNLDDILFNYGIRINPNLVQDSFCSTIPIESGDGSGYIETPWFYSPILLTNPKNSITKDISGIKSEFVSSISSVNNKNDQHIDVLFTTSNHSNLISIPETISIDTDNQNFNTSYIPIGISIDGIFRSNFRNRMIPDSLDINENPFIENSKNTKMIVIGTSSIIKNNVSEDDESISIEPLGYDKSSGKTYDNKEFIISAMNWLINDQNLIQIKSKSRNMDLLNKQEIVLIRNKYAILNTITPILFFLLILCSIYIYRKYKYTKQEKF